MRESLETGRTRRTRRGRVGPRSILVVEREAKAARQIKLSLKRLGYAVLATAKSASEALGAVEAHHPSLIVMDVGLQGSDDGIAAAAAIQARYPTPVVFLTERSDAGAWTRTQERAHPHGCVLKPYADLELRVAVEAALARHGLEQELRKRQSLFANVFSGMSDAVAAADVDGNIVLANDARRAGFGEQATITSITEEGSGHRVYRPDDETLFPVEELPLARALLGETIRDVEIFVRSDREAGGRWYSVNAEPLRDADGVVCGAVEVGRDVTLLRAARSELVQQSETDALTGVYNRRGFIHVARSAYEIASQSGRQPAVFFIDLNGMKHINDSLGHREGDRLLMDVAWIVRACFRTSDIVGRFGGDEFVVLAPDAGEHADLICERLRMSVEQFNGGSERSYRISMSIGMSLLEPGQPVSLDELVERADKRMYEDKVRRAGRRTARDGRSLSATSSDAHPRPRASLRESAVPVAPRPSLACIPPPALDFSPRCARDRRPVGGRKRILMVDDDPQNLTVLERLLAPLGHELIRASDGRAAMATFATQRPDLVLLDLVMPGLSGLDVVSRIRANSGGEHVPVVVLTAHTEAEHRMRGLEAGADDYIEKPTDGRSLRARVTTLLQLKESRDELLRLNDELHSRNGELSRLQQEQRELTAFVVHDLKNPLATVWSDLDFAKDQLGGDRPDVDEVLGEASVACERLRSMIDDLMVISRLEDAPYPPHDQLVDLWDLLREVFCDYMKRAADKHVTLLGPQGSDARVKADRALLRRVIENILDNSLRYTPANGRMGIATSANDAIEITVSNSGPPIPVVERKRIFEKFARIEKRSAVGNAGLGLYFCKRVIESLGGTIEVTETAEWPTSFVMRLPASA